MAKRVQTLKRNPDGNPKYRHVKSVVDSGASVTRYLDAIEKLRSDFNVKRNEIFKRIKVEVFVNLVIELNSFDYQDSPSPISDGGDSSDTLSVRCDDDIGARCDTARSTLHSVVTGMGELDLSEKRETRQTAARGPAEELVTPYLLLDVRERDCYQQCHIITAVSYPAIMLTRSINYETPALLQFKNKPEKIIILYDEDELVAPGAASTFVQRGYDNIYVLSGGLKVACKRFPAGLVIGRPPARCATADKPSTSRRTAETVLAPKEVDWANCRDLSNNFTRDDVDLLQQQLARLQLFPANGLATARSWSSSSVQSERSRRSDASKSSVSSAGLRVPWK